MLFRSQQAVWLACTGLNRVPWGASHGIGHQLGAVAAVPHGFTSCVMLPHVLDFNATVTAEQQRRISIALGLASESAAEAVRRLVAELELPCRLSDVGVDETDLELIAESSLGNLFVRQNPRKMQGADILRLLRDAY